jgi:hypothetical protein
MSQVKPKAEEFPSWADVRAITVYSGAAVLLALLGRIAGHGSDCFVAIVAALLLVTLQPWWPR